MDFLDIIITIAILGGASLFSGKSGKRAGRRQQTAGSQRPVMEAQPVPDFGFDVDEDDVFSDEMEDEKVAFDNTYFSYEQQPSEEESRQPERQVAEAEPVVAASAAPEPAVSVMDEPFDLRKAVIYQTIMERVAC